MADAHTSAAHGNAHVRLVQLASFEGEAAAASWAGYAAMNHGVLVAGAREARECACAPGGGRRAFRMTPATEIDARMTGDGEVLVCRACPSSIVVAYVRRRLFAAGDGGTHARTTACVSFRRDDEDDEGTPELVLSPASAAAASPKEPANRGGWFKALWSDKTPPTQTPPAPPATAELGFDTSDEATGLFWLGGERHSGALPWSAAHVGNDSATPVGGGLLAVGYRYAGVVVYAVAVAPTTASRWELKAHPLRVLQHGFAPPAAPVATVETADGPVRALRGGAWRFVHTHGTKCCLVGGGRGVGAEFVGWQILWNAPSPGANGGVGTFNASRIERFTAPLAGARTKHASSSEAVDASPAAALAGGAHLLTLRGKIVLALEDPVNSSIALMRVYADTSLPLARLRVDLAPDLWVNLGVTAMDNMVAIHSPSAGLSMLFDIDTAAAAARRASLDDAILPLAPPLPPLVEGAPGDAVPPFTPGRHVVIASPNVIVDVDAGRVYQALLDAPGTVRCLPSAASALAFLLRRALGPASTARPLVLSMLLAGLEERTIAPALVEQAVAVLVRNAHGADVAPAELPRSPAWLHAAFEACAEADAVTDAAPGTPAAVGRELLHAVLAPLAARLFTDHGNVAAARAQGAMLYCATSGTRRAIEKRQSSSVPSALILLEVLLAAFPAGDPASCPGAGAAMRAWPHPTTAICSDAAATAVRTGLLAAAAHVRSLAVAGGGGAAGGRFPRVKAARQLGQTCASLVRVAHAL